MLIALAPALSEHHDLLRVEPVVHLEGVLQGEGVDVDDDRRAAGLGDHAGVVADLLFLGGDEQHFHAAARVRAGAGVQDLVIEVDVLDVERDVLLRLPVDRFGQLRLGHHRERDLLDDDGAPRQRGAHVLGLEGTALEDALDRVRDRGGVDDGAVDDGVGGHRLDAECGHTEVLGCRLELDRLYRAGANVQPDYALLLPKHRYLGSPVEGAKPVVR